MGRIRVLTWNVCGDKQERADLAIKVIDKEEPDIMFFQEARKTNPKCSNMYDVISNLGVYEFAFCNEFQDGGISFGGQKFYPFVGMSKAYYAFVRKGVFNPGDIQLDLVDYVCQLNALEEDAKSYADQLTQRRPAFFELTHSESGETVIFFTWHAPLSEAGGGVFNETSHEFFSWVANNLAEGKVGIIAGDMNATAKEIGSSYPDDWVAAGHHLDHVVTNKDLENCCYYDDVKSDVHYLYLADVVF